MTAVQQQFEEARKLFPGKKRGFKTEWDNFVKKNKDYKEVIEKLLPAIQYYINYLNWQHTINEFAQRPCAFAVWTNQRRWEEEYPDYDTYLKEKKSRSPIYNPGDDREDMLR